MCWNERPCPPAIPELSIEKCVSQGQILLLSVENNAEMFTSEETPRRQIGRCQSCPIIGQSGVNRGTLGYTY